MLLEFALIAMFDGHQREVKVFETASECAAAFDYLNAWVFDARAEAVAAQELSSELQGINNSYAELEKANPQSFFIKKYTLTDVIEAANDQKKWDDMLMFAKASDMLIGQVDDKFVHFQGEASEVLYGISNYRHTQQTVEDLKLLNSFEPSRSLNIETPRIPNHTMLPKSVEYTCLPILKYFTAGLLVQSIN